MNGPTTTTAATTNGEVTSRTPLQLPTSNAAAPGRPVVRVAPITQVQNADTTGKFDLGFLKILPGPSMYGG